MQKPRSKGAEPFLASMMLKSCFPVEGLGESNITFSAFAILTVVCDGIRVGPVEGC